MSHIFPSYSAYSIHLNQAGLLKTSSSSQLILKGINSPSDFPVQFTSLSSFILLSDQGKGRCFAASLSLKLTRTYLTVCMFVFVFDCLVNYIIQTIQITLMYCSLKQIHFSDSPVISKHSNSDYATSFVSKIPQSTRLQGEANWNCQPLLNHITGHHISFFCVGHTSSTSVFTLRSFPT